MTASYAITDLPLEWRLRPPAPRPGTVPRTALLNRLRVAPGAPVLVVTAPPGYGKTTLLADWARRDERAFAWLTLDATDDDPRALLGSLTAAVERVHECDASVVAALAARRFDAQAVLARISHWLDAAEAPTVVVLDDVHRISSARSLDVLRKLVTALPPGTQLVVAGRSEPPLPLARLRAEGRLAELGVADLRLTSREASALLSAVGLELTGDEVRRLEESTEGWPAGLYLAALALRGGSGGGGTGLAEVGGADRFLTDYFRLEALASLPAAQVEFLLQACVLEEMSGPACDAVLERSGSARALESLERSNLFVIPLDRERRVYRFHRLFREMLEAELSRSEPAAVVSLNERAADWAEQHGDVQAAIGHAHAAGDLERVRRLVESSALPSLEGGELEAVSGRLAGLDEADAAVDYPAIAYLSAFTNALLGRADAAGHWARVAEGGEHAVAMPDGSSSTEPWAALLRAVLGRGGAERMRDDAELAVATLAPDSMLRPSALVHAGLAQLLLDEQDEADTRFEDAAEAGKASGAAVSATLALAERSLLAAARADWDTAEHHALAARETVSANRLEGYATSALPFAVSARSALRHGHWVRAAGRRRAGRAPASTPDLRDAGARRAGASRAGARAARAGRRKRRGGAARRGRRDSRAAAGARRARGRGRRASPRAGRGRRPRGLGLDAHRRGVAAPAAPDHLPLLPRDRRAALRLAQHGQDAGDIGLPQARRLLAQRGDRTGDRARPRGRPDGAPDRLRRIVPIG